MKQTLTIVLLFSIFIFTNSVRAGNDFLGNNLVKKKHQARNTRVLNSKKLFAEGGDSFGEGKMIVSVGYGALSGGIIKAVLKAYDDKPGYSFSSFGPIHFRGEFGLSDKMGLVLSINHNSWVARWTHVDSALSSTIYQAEWKRSVTSILARINIHFGTTERLDPYWGIGAGYRLAEHTFTSNPVGYTIPLKNPFHLGFETTLGFRYYFIEGLGVYAELGLAQSIIQGGLVVAF